MVLAAANGISGVIEHRGIVDNRGLLYRTGDTGIDLAVWRTW
jgi:hypothetical protein